MNKRNFIKLLTGMVSIAATGSASAAVKKTINTKGNYRKEFIAGFKYQEAIKKIPDNEFKAQKNIKLNGFYDSRCDIYRVRTEVLKENGDTFYDLLEISGRKNKKLDSIDERVTKTAKYINMVLENAGLSERVTERMAIDAFSHSNGNYLLDMVN